MGFMDTVKKWFGSAKEMADDLGEKAAPMMDKAKEMAGDLGEKAAPMMEKAKEAASEAFEKARDVAEDFRTKVEGEAEELASVHGRYADLLIISQADVNAPNASAAMDDIQSVIFAAGRPLLLVPYTGKIKTLGKNVFVAWNASREATRAVTDALPLLQRADKVTVMVVRPRADARAHGEIPGADIAAYLARHEVKVDVMAEEGEGIDVGELMLSRVADLGSDLIVMGAYSHSRLRQWILGGATRTMLESMTVPVLMSH